MFKTKINAQIVADSINPQGDRLTTFLVTFPRIILAEVNTHRAFSRNTSSSRAIPFNKMIESVENDPFIPIAWQFSHKGMQGIEYVTEESDFGGISARNESWLSARDCAIRQAEDLNSMDTTKQLCNRLLEPFMWTTMLITGSKEGWDNFFELRCPQYEYYDMLTGDQQFFKSKKDWLQYYNNKPLPKAKHISKIPENDVEWLQINKGQAEIHMMALAEEIYDAMNESTPKQLKAGEWHIPFGDKINTSEFSLFKMNLWKNKQAPTNGHYETLVKISTAMAARTSYTVIGDEKEIDYDKLIDLHDKLITADPLHASPLEHCAQVMNSEEYYSYLRTNGEVIDITVDGENIYSDNSYGWCRNFKGFKQYRYLIEEKNYNAKY